MCSAKGVTLAAGWRFLVRPADVLQNDSRTGDVAEFMFEHEDPRDCTRRAVEVLRQEGWRAVALSDAQEGFTPGDFLGRGDFRELYDTASVAGISYLIHNPDLAGATGWGT